MNRKILLIVIVGIGYSQCISCKRTIKSDVECKGLHMAVRMADSEMIHFPNSSTVDFNPKGKWGYTAGLVAKSMVELWKQTGEIKYYDYAKSYADQFINANGEIKGYKRSDFNIDNVNSGNFLFDLYQNTHDDRYKKAIFILRDQLNDHPRTTEGGFWHKKRYTHQMWLDGLYMGEPFYARFGSEFNEPEAFDDVINQFVVVHKHTYNSEVGLNYHGWDESKEQAWANPENGCSLHFWGRAMGWYAMAVVDILDFIPENHPKREELIGIVKQVAAGIEEVQDPKTGLWYQVLDLGNKEGNYLESSCSCMFVYSLLKASRLNYIDKRYRLVAEKGYDGILKNFIKENVDETISIKSVCSVAGLGGTPYRDGSYDYYIKEPVRDNDPKGIGPFILASIEMNN